LDPKRRTLLLSLGVTLGAFLLLVLVTTSGVFGGRAPREPNDWLLNADGDEERLKTIQKHLRGFDMTMWETGERYQRLHDALQRQNYRMAVYQWEKIGQTISNGIERRPRWAEPAEEIFFGTYKAIQADFQSADRKRAWAAFDQARASCMGCHQVSNVEHMNNQSLFEFGSPPSRILQK
jgi:hypothetical protein